MSLSTSRKPANLSIARAKLALVAASMTAFTVPVADVQACEKHLNGHQNGSDTHQEFQSGSQQK